MSGKSGKNIPRPYRRPISKRKFAAMLKTLSDRSEEKNIRKCFPLGDDGKHRFTKPQKEKDAAEIAGILKKSSISFAPASRSAMTVADSTARPRENRYEYGVFP